MSKPKPFAIQDPDVTHVVIELFGGDNNLSRFVLEDLQEMAAGNRGAFATLALTDVANGGGQVVEFSPRTGHRVVEEGREGFSCTRRCHRRGRHCARAQVRRIVTSAFAIGWCSH